MSGRGACGVYYFEIREWTDREPPCQVHRLAGCGSVRGWVLASVDHCVHRCLGQSSNTSPRARPTPRSRAPTRLFCVRLAREQAQGKLLPPDFLGDKEACEFRYHVHTSLQNQPEFGAECRCRAVRVAARRCVPQDILTTRIRACSVL